jgi:hypothetical protein
VQHREIITLIVQQRRGSEHQQAGRRQSELSYGFELESFGVIPSKERGDLVCFVYDDHGRAKARFKLVNCPNFGYMHRVVEFGVEAESSSQFVFPLLDECLGNDYQNPMLKRMVMDMLADQQTGFNGFA